MPDPTPNINPKKGYQEKRIATRLYRRFILRAAPFGDQPLRWTYVTIHNLSSTGILFTFDKYTYEGMLLYLRIDFPDRLIECMGRIVRIAGEKSKGLQDVAARFEGLSMGDREYIDFFIDQNSD